MYYSELKTYKKMILYENRQIDVIKSLEKFIKDNKLNRNLFNDLFEVLMKPNVLISNYDDVIKAFLAVSKKLKDKDLKDKLGDILAKI